MFSGALRSRSLAAAVLVLGAGMAAPQSDPELDVVSAALSTAVAGGRSVVVLSHELSAQPGMAHAEGLMADRLGRAFLEAYDSANASPRRLLVPLTVPGRTVVFEDQVPARKPTDVMFVYRFTRVGFNSAHDTAMVGVYEDCGMTCGSARHEIYVRSSAGWRRIGGVGASIQF